MKRKQFTSATLTAALCLLATACSNENTPNNPQPTDGATRTLTIDCGIGTTATTPGTRAGVTPGNTDSNKETFIWHAGDQFAAYLMPQPNTEYDNTPVIFNIDPNYTDAAPGNAASFTSNQFPNQNIAYNVLAGYPKEAFSRSADNPSSLIHTLSTAQAQTGKNDTRHLATHMAMYALATVAPHSEALALDFKHRTSLFRFTVDNENSVPYRITQIKITCPNSVFGTECAVSASSFEAEGAILATPTKGAQSITLQLNNTLPSDPPGIPLSARNDPSKGNIFDAYAIATSGTQDLTNQTLTFSIDITDPDGTNPRTYQALELDANRIIAANNNQPELTPGKRYWFDLVLDDNFQLTIGDIRVTNWATGDDIPGGEALNQTTANPATHTVYIANGGELTADLIKKALAGSKDLKIAGNMNDADISTIYNWAMDSYNPDSDLLHTLDLSRVEGLTELPYYAFNESYSSIVSLKSITLPETLTTIRGNAFEGCSSLQSCIAPNVETIESYAFMSCESLTSITTSKLKSIGQDAFNGCGFTSFVAPKLNYIGPKAFYDCNSLTTLRLTTPDDIELFSYNHFQNTTKNCILYLHPNKQPGSTGTPSVSNTSSWGDKYWKEVRYENENEN